MVDRARSPSQVCMSIDDYLEDVHRPFLIFFKQIVAEHGRDHAMRMARSAGEALGREMARSQLGDRHIDDFEEFRSFWRSLMSSPIFSATQEVSILEEGPDHLRMRVDRCLWAEYFQRIGDTELGYLVCCNADHSMLATYNPRLRLHRTKTIMQGDDHCDHCFRWSEG